MGKAVSYVTDPRFLVGVAVGWFVVPYGLKFIQLKMQLRNGAGVSASAG